MQWIDEMFANMGKIDTADEAKRRAERTPAGRSANRKKALPGMLAVWNGLIGSITSDVNEFNLHKERAGHIPVRLYQRKFQFEVYLPGMQGKRLILTLANNDLQVSVPPDFPKQPLTITVEADPEGQHEIWVLGEATKERLKLSAQQLSEYLLKPVLCSAAVN